MPASAQDLDVLGLDAAGPVPAPAFSDIPGPLLERLGRKATAQELVDQLLQELQRADSDGNGLDHDDIDLALQFEAAQQRVGRMVAALRADLDGNGEVTLDEITRSVTYEMRVGQEDIDAERLKKQVQEAVDAAMREDSNRDGVITLAELLQDQPQKRKQRQAQRSLSLLELDQDGDGRLTGTELEATVRKAFQAVDYDGDGTLSTGEIKLLEPAREQARALQAALPCDLPKPADQERVMVVGAYSGGLQPNVTIAGQNDSTALTTLAIEPGQTPLYLLLSSYDPMIWQFTGATERVARVVAVPGRANSEASDAPGVGVAGLPADKVTFLPVGSCGGAFHKTASKEARIKLLIVEKQTGRAPNDLIGAYMSRRIALPSGTVQLEASSGRTVVVTGEGEDVVYGDPSKIVIIQDGDGLQLQQQEDWLGSADRLVEIDPATVVAPGKVELYDVMPQQFGLRQLVQEGKLLRTKQGYRIVAPIPRFPAGLAGAHGVTFILPKGMPMPAGDPGHSEVILDETPQQ
jgi:Ca2+-binding EF-hand superfamily protein